MPKSVAKKSKTEKDDLDLENEDDEEEAEDEEETEEEDEEEDTEEEAEESEEEDEEEADEESEDEEEGEKPKKEAGKRGRPKGGKNKIDRKGPEGSLGIVLLRTGVPKQVEILKVMGKNVKVRKPGVKDAPAFRIPITDVRLHDEETFEKLQEVAEKITTLIDKNRGLFSKLSNLAARRGTLGKKNPLEEL